MVNNENRLKSLRKEKGFSGIQIARDLGITPQYYYDIEKGERRLTTEIAAKVADILETTVDYLIGKVDVNTYQLNETASEYKTSPDSHNESELSPIPIEKLNQFKLTYKGQTLSEDEANDVIELLEAALKRWKK